MTSKAADELETLIFEAAATPSSQQLLQARQCHLRCLSLLCLGPLETLSAADAAEIVQLMVLIKSKHIFLDSVPAAEAQRLSALHMRCHNVTARHSCSLAWLSLLHAPQILTAAAACVIDKLGPDAVTPVSLNWQRLPGSSCFEASGSDGHLYTINTLDGTVLIDGLPPSRLPKSILMHPLFRRCFGDRNFEVARIASGVLETLKPVQGRFYTFNPVSPETLVIIEVDKEEVCSWLGLLHIESTSEGRPCINLCGIHRYL